MTSMRPLYPETNACETGWINGSGGHRAFWECHGNPNGMPVLHLCGGPGGAPSRMDARYFNPFGFRIILLHPRGCGRSAPRNSLDDNTLDHLLNDIEALRATLGITRWLISGASWGSTIALAYAQAHPERVSALILRGVFLCEPQELDYLYGGVAGLRHQREWARFCAWTDAKNRRELLEAYARALHSGERDAQFEAAARWCAWEDHLCGLQPGRAQKRPESMEEQLTLARMSVHYFLNDGFLEPGELIDGAARLGNIPGFIVHGTDDEVTRVRSAVALHRAWPTSTLKIIEGAGHLAHENDEIIDALIGSINSCLDL